MKTIYGNNFLISIAFTAETPSQAAKIAQLAGLPRDKVRAVRNASVFLRDNGKDEFKKVFDPFTVMDTTVNACKTMTVKLQLNKTFERRPLNEEEFNEVAAIISGELKRLGIDATILLKDSKNPFVKSTL